MTARTLTQTGLVLTLAVSALACAGDVLQSLARPFRMKVVEPQLTIVRGEEGSLTVEIECGVNLGEDVEIRLRSDLQGVGFWTPSPAPTCAKRRTTSVFHNVQVWMLPLTVQEGVHQAKIIGNSVADGTTESASFQLTVTRDPVPPTFVSPPAIGGVVSALPASLLAIASDNVSISAAHYVVNGGQPQAITVEPNLTTYVGGSTLRPLVTLGADLYGLQAGGNSVTVTVVDLDGNEASGTVNVTYTPAGNAPVAVIDAPADGAAFAEGSPVTFDGSAVDASGAATTATLEWSSDLDGVLGTGAPLTVNTLGTGTHTITLTATDQAGLMGSSSISIDVFPNCTDFTLSVDPSSLTAAPSGGNYYATVYVAPVGGFADPVQLSLEDSGSTPVIGNLITAHTFNPNPAGPESGLDFTVAGGVANPGDSFTFTLRGVSVVNDTSQCAIPVTLDVS